MTLSSFFLHAHTRTHKRTWNTHLHPRKEKCKSRPKAKTKNNNYCFSSARATPQLALNIKPKYRGNADLPPSLFSSACAAFSLSVFLCLLQQAPSFRFPLHTLFAKTFSKNSLSSQRFSLFSLACCLLSITLRTPSQLPHPLTLTFLLAMQSNNFASLTSDHYLMPIFRDSFALLTHSHWTQTALLPAFQQNANCKLSQLRTHARLPPSLRILLLKGFLFVCLLFCLTTRYLYRFKYPFLTSKMKNGSALSAVKKRDKSGLVLMSILCFNLFFIIIINAKLYENCTQKTQT